MRYRLTRSQTDGSERRRNGQRKLMMDLDRLEEECASLIKKLRMKDQLAVDPTRASRHQYVVLKCCQPARGGKREGCRLLVSVLRGKKFRQTNLSRGVEKSNRTCDHRRINGRLRNLPFAKATSNSRYINTSVSLCHKNERVSSECSRLKGNHCRVCRKCWTA